MPVTSDPELRIVHGLRVRGLTETPELAEAVGLEESEVATRIADLAEAGHVLHRDGRLVGWALTPKGRTHGEELVAEELDVAGEREAVGDLYRRFLGFDPGFKALCTDWQLSNVEDQVLNDHTDAAYDAVVVARLAEVNGAVQPICAELAGRLERFDDYGRRFSEALRRVVAGEVNWFTGMMIDSYHTVWFELHENLLATLGIERAEEGEQT